MLQTVQNELETTNLKSVRGPDAHYAMWDQDSRAHTAIYECVFLNLLQTEYQYTRSTIKARTFWLVLKSKDCLRLGFVVASELVLGSG